MKVNRGHTGWDEFLITFLPVKTNVTLITQGAQDFIRHAILPHLRQLGSKIVNGPHSSEKHFLSGCLCMERTDKNLRQTCFGGN